MAPDEAALFLVRATNRAILSVLWRTPIEALAGGLLAALEQSKKTPEAAARWTERGQLFFQGLSGGNKQHPQTLLRELRATSAQLYHLTVLHNRLDRNRSRHDKRTWVQDRRARTRHLIELGGLIQKARLVELMDDDRATLLGALLALADQLREDGQPEENGRQHASPADLVARWRRCGLRAFDADKEMAAAGAVASLL